MPNDKTSFILPCFRFFWFTFIFACASSTPVKMKQNMCNHVATVWLVSQMPHTGKEIVKRVYWTNETIIPRILFCSFYFFLRILLKCGFNWRVDSIKHKK